MHDTPVAAQPVPIEDPARVQDGDTLEIGPVLVRLNGIDAPEVAPPASGTAAGFRVRPLGPGRNRRDYSLRRNREPERRAEEQIYDRVLRDRADPSFDAPGLTVEGAGIAAVTARPGFALGAPEPLDTGRTAVAADPDAARAATILLTLESGAALPLAVLNDLTAHVTIEGDAVVDIRYTPLAGTELSEVFNANRDEIETLRSAVGAAVIESTFLFGGSAERDSNSDPAERLAASFAELAPFDPTLALYAAYALDTAQRDALVASVATTSAVAIGVRLFDLALLSSRGPKGQRLPDGLVPFCPALRPGWSVVRAHDIPQPAPVRAAMPFLTDSPWTVFAPEGARILKTAIETGELP